MFGGLVDLFTGGSHSRQMQQNSFAHDLEIANAQHEADLRARRIKQKEAEQKQDQEYQLALKKMQMERERVENAIQLEHKRQSEADVHVRELEIRNMEQKKAELQEKIAAEKRKQIQATIDKYQQRVNESDQKVVDVEKDMPAYTRNIDEYKEKLKSKQQQLSKLETGAEKKDILTKVSEYKKQYEENDATFRAALNQTGVHGSKIQDFLNLAANIIPSTIQSVQQANNLNANFKTFYEIISRDCNDKLTIENYFAHEGLSRFVPALQHEELYNVEDLECDDADEYDEILSILREAVKVAKKQKKVDDEKEQLLVIDNSSTVEEQKADEQKEAEEKENSSITDLNTAKKVKKEKKLASGFNIADRKKIKRICTKPETWQKFQQEISVMNKAILLECSPTLASFFERMHIAMSDVTKLLAIGYEYNPAQQLALQGSSMKIIHAPVNTDSKESEELPVMKFNDEKLSRVANDNKIIGKLAVSTINVIESMAEVFAVSKKAKTFALNIEDTCGQLVQAQCSLRSNVVLAMEILSLKPSKMSPDAKKLWESVDQGCIEIFTSAVDMIAVSAQYFGFFLRFKDSFDRYLTAMEINSDCSFVVSLQYLKKDLREFLVFKDKFADRLEDVNARAKVCIKDCVINSAGADNFECVYDDWEKSQEKYFKSLESLREREVELDAKYVQLKNEESDIMGHIAKNDFLLKTAVDKIVHIRKMQNEWTARIEKLSVKVVENFETV